jgi:glutamine amidotransferase
MQILFTEGTENEGANGVNVISGKVEKLAVPVLPHMGWNTVKVFGESQLFKGIEDESFYFVHSYAVKSAEVKAGATSNYHGEFLAALELGPLAATQFHPEKSGAAGLKLIKNWVAGL